MNANLALISILICYHLKTFFSWFKSVLFILHMSFQKIKYCTKRLMLSLVL